MHILFIHPNYPAQFGHVAQRLTEQHGVRCTFLSRRAPGKDKNVERIHYPLRGCYTAQTHPFSRAFENATWHSAGVYQALRARRDIEPDLIVAHSGFLGSVFLRELYSCPIINYFEWFYGTEAEVADFRPDFPSSEFSRLRGRSRNGVLLLDLENCDAGYSPTHWQRKKLPQAFRDKINVIFDGVDTNIWKPQPWLPRRVGNRNVPPETKVVTYVSRGMESMRGFDIFMEAAHLLCRMRKDVVFVVVGEDRVCYGGDQQITRRRSFKQWVLSKRDYDLSRFFFTGWLPRDALAALLAGTDVHVYLTVPFVLSWSLMNALACRATVVASDTAPVHEMITNGRNGLLVDFFDVEGFAITVSSVLDSPDDYAHLGAAAVDFVNNHYSVDVCLPRMLELYERTVKGGAVRPN